jgi:uncharacterized membrane protein YdjX (TVP38/TMEM64 family)
MTKYPPQIQPRAVPDVPSGNSGRSKLILLMLVISAAGTAAWLLRDELSLQKLAAREAAFRTFQIDHPVLVYVAAFATYVVVAGLSLPGATALTLLIAWLFGFWRGMLVVSFGSTAGATVAFLLSRYLLRDAITKKFGDRLRVFNDALQREGAFYLFTLRLIPAVPFFVINAVMGLTPLASSEILVGQPVRNAAGNGRLCLRGSQRSKASNAGRQRHRSRLYALANHTNTHRIRAARLVSVDCTVSDETLFR